MDIFLTSLFLVAIAEIGDKTQLLAILLATRFRRPWPIIGGIFAATLVNHALAALVGDTLAGVLSGRWFAFAIAASFLAMAIWALIPDRLEDEQTQSRPQRYGVFVTTLIAFFLVEMGDKTQVATVALGARFHNVPLVAAGTTAGMMLANIPAVLFGERITRVVPLRLVRPVAAAIFVFLGVWTLVEALRG
jgi:putative Ca2+/H+ antiporter (TMEM165/GDT1 family)